MLTSQNSAQSLKLVEFALKLLLLMRTFLVLVFYLLEPTVR